jgi:hypothetical protein
MSFPSSPAFSHANSLVDSLAIAGSALSSIAAIATSSPRSRAARATSNGSGPLPAISPSTAIAAASR